MEGWTEFFLGELGAAAAIAGLLVVAISINLERILATPTLPGGASNTLVIIGGALTVAGAALVPRQPLWPFGSETLLVFAVVAASGLREFITIWGLHKRGDRFGWITSFLLGFAATVIPNLIGSVLLMLGNDTGVYWIAGGIILGILVALQFGWQLLIGIVRTRPAAKP